MHVCIKTRSQPKASLLRHPPPSFLRESITAQLTQSGQAAHLTDLPVLTISRAAMRNMNCATLDLNSASHTQAASTVWPELPPEPPVY